MPTIPLCDLAPGQYGRVQQLSTMGSMRRRLLDLGLIPGAVAVCVGRAPGGNPAAYRINGAVVALRRADAATVWVDSPWD